MQLTITGYAIAFSRFRKVLHVYTKTTNVGLTVCRAEFHKNQGVGKKDFGTIEYLLRRGRRQLETYQDPGIRDLH